MWEEPPLQTTEDTKIGKTLLLRDNYGGVPPGQQLERGINFSEVFKDLDFSTICNPNETPQTTSSPVTVVEVDLNLRDGEEKEEWRQLLPHSLQELLRLESARAQPPSPVSLTPLSEPRTSGVLINMLSGHAYLHGCSAGAMTDISAKIKFQHFVHDRNMRQVAVIFPCEIRSVVLVEHVLTPRLDI